MCRFTNFYLFVGACYFVFLGEDFCEWYYSLRVPSQVYGQVYQIRMLTHTLISHLSSHSLSLSLSSFCYFIYTLSRPPPMIPSIIVLTPNACACILIALGNLIIRRRGFIILLVGGEGGGSCLYCHENLQWYSTKVCLDSAQNQFHTHICSYWLKFAQNYTWAFSPLWGSSNIFQVMLC